jgi:hypothetical protein
VLTNKQIVQSARVLFAHTDAYNLPSTFANRTDSKKFLRERLEDGAPQITVISDILGSGKTYLMTMVKSDLGLTDRKPLMCGRVNIKDLQTTAPVFVDEWDIKAKPSDILATLDLLSEKMRSAAGPIVLLGDLTLKSDRFRELLGSLAPTDYVPMEPLNPHFFRLAMSQRVQRVADTLKIETNQASIIDPELEAALVPNWELTSANFREVFHTLSNLSLMLRQTSDGPGAVGGEEVRAWLSTRSMPEMSNDQKLFCRSYRKFIRSQVMESGWSAIKPMDARELATATGIKPRGQAAFRANVLEPLARDRAQSILASVGKPEISLDGSSYSRFPGPYLPSAATRLQAVFGEEE